MGVAFGYTPARLGESEVLRPCLAVFVGFEGRVAPAVSMMVDTGSDACIIDTAVAHMAGFDPSRVGKKTLIEGLTKAQDAYLVPVQILVRDLKREVNAEIYFTQLRGIAGILGHGGFLEEFSVTFVKGRYFEFNDVDENV